MESFDLLSGGANSKPLTSRTIRVLGFHSQRTLGCTNALRVAWLNGMRYSSAAKFNEHVTDRYVHIAGNTTGVVQFHWADSTNEFSHCDSSHHSSPCPWSYQASLCSIKANTFGARFQLRNHTDDNEIHVDPYAIMGTAVSQCADSQSIYPESQRKWNEYFAGLRICCWLQCARCRCTEWEIFDLGSSVTINTAGNINQFIYHSSKIS